MRVDRWVRSWEPSAEGSRDGSAVADCGWVTASSKPHMSISTPLDWKQRDDMLSSGVLAPRRNVALFAQSLSALLTASMVRLVTTFDVPPVRPVS